MVTKFTANIKNIKRGRKTVVQGRDGMDYNRATCKGGELNEVKSAPMRAQRSYIRTNVISVRSNPILVFH